MGIPCIVVLHLVKSLLRRTLKLVGISVSAYALYAFVYVELNDNDEFFLGVSCHAVFRSSVEHYVTYLYRVCFFSDHAAFKLASGVIFCREILQSIVLLHLPLLTLSYKQKEYCATTAPVSTNLVEAQQNAEQVLGRLLRNTSFLDELVRFFRCVSSSVLC